MSGAERWEPGGVRYSPAHLARLLGLPDPTPEQAAVISAPMEPLAVIAGAGSGKSETMAARLVWLVANGMVRPERVLGLTFTRKAAGELGQRVRVRLAGLRRVGLDTATGGAQAGGRGPTTGSGGGPLTGPAGEPLTRLPAGRLAAGAGGPTAADRSMAADRYMTAREGASGRGGGPLTGLTGGLRTGAPGGTLTGYLGAAAVRQAGADPAGAGLTGGGLAGAGLATAGGVPGGQAGPGR